jgi:hypothetical protein
LASSWLLAGSLANAAEMPSRWERSVRAKVTVE